ncbi:sensor histidine kinase [Mesorhizobium microcysteis]|uniref:histidine kinase n=1 Tax=Neoaquamicrobium microcysteis TaxID=2682781 RepID=A0A5D4GTD5_9HYPH|nr:HWE histidine kinase domain-containing protein [Mesorhizobium microcysteis]TYR31608.1 sensor histidine kinase [Mesorhizobium microcysteis]
MMHDAVVLAPSGRDARVARDIIAGGGFKALVAESLADALAVFEQSLCLVVTEEALLSEDRAELAAWMENQPTWSDYPVVLLSTRGVPQDTRLEFLDVHAINLERPFSPQALVSAVRSAGRARKRQLEVRSFIENQARIEDRQRLLIRELHHRVKNTLSNVQAVLGATARSAGSIDEFYAAFSERITSLARTHTFLTDDYWQVASLQQMLESELSHFASHPKQIMLAGPKVELVADIAVPLGMAFHELASNSAKYGSLTNGAGSLSVSWDISDEDDGRCLKLEWVEKGGPSVHPPERKGFGTVLLHKVLTIQCEADVETVYDESGFILRLELPLKRDRLVPQYELA